MSLCIDVRLERLFAPPCVGTGHRFIDSSGHQVILDFRLRQSEIGNLACHSSLVTGHCPFDLRFSESTKWFIFSPGTVDNRSGGVWAARLIVNVPGCPHFRPRTSYPGLRTLRLATGHSLLVFFDLGLRTSDFGPCISTLFFFDFGPRTSDPVSRHCSFSTSDLGPRTLYLDTVLFRLRTSDLGPCISTLFFFDFGLRTSDRVSRHCSFDIRPARASRHCSSAFPAHHSSLVTRHCSSAPLVRA
jgi:hypothetical protein